MCVLERGCGVMYVYVCTSRHVCVSLCVWKVVEVVCIYIYIYVHAGMRVFVRA